MSDDQYVPVVRAMAIIENRGQLAGVMRLALRGKVRYRCLPGGAILYHAGDLEKARDEMVRV